MSGVYIHIPYCRQACCYCDFHFRAAMKDKNAMLAAMKKEIALRKDYLRETEPDGEKIPVETLYFGGGTPSTLLAGELAELLETVNLYYSLAPGAEVTLEANPDDLSGNYLDNLIRLGFNRLSIGVQSFFDDDLKWMRRRHNALEASQAVEAATGCGFRNINIDLIYGLPSMNAARWLANLERAFALGAPHLSAYHLTVEPRTVLGKRQARGESFAVSEDESVRQFGILLDAADRAGYEHYEISNFARSGFRSRHNAAYWRRRPYIGVGPSAHSFDGRSRQWNIASNSGYIAALNSASALTGNSGETPAWYERELLTPAEQYNEYALLSLRAAWGADAGHIRSRFGDALADEFLRQAAVYVQNGYMQEHAGVFTLTRKGKMIADRIASDLFCA